MLPFVMMLTLAAAQPPASETADDVARRVRIYVESNWTVTGPADPSRRLGFTGTFAPRARGRLAVKCDTGPAGVVTYTTFEGDGVCAAYPYRDPEGVLRARVSLAAPGAAVVEHDLWRHGGGGGDQGEGWMLLHPTPDSEEPGDRAEAEKSRAMAACQPRDIEAAIQCLDVHWTDEVKRGFAALPAKEVIRTHIGVGMWIRNNWGLWKGGALRDFFAAQGVRHPDSMSSVLLNAYWLKLQGCTVEWNDPAAVERQFQRALRGERCSGD